MSEANFLQSLCQGVNIEMRLSRLHFDLGLRSYLLWFISPVFHFYFLAPYLVSSEAPVLPRLLLLFVLLILLAMQSLSGLDCNSQLATCS